MTTIKKRKHKLDAHRDRILSGLKQGKKKIDILREITVQSITPQTLRNWLKENSES
ncbi:TPA: hypothetical protein ACPJ18_004172 [Vibrio alginolyticus]